MFRSTLPTILPAIMCCSLAGAQKTTPPPPAPRKPVVESTSASESTRLPVKRVVLYKNGVGYFEHST